MSRSIPRPARLTILRFVATRDVGKAIHSSYVEGQIQGGVARGIGWALNVEYIYNWTAGINNHAIAIVALYSRITERF